MYKLLKKSDHFMWTNEAQEALDTVKEVLVNPPVLVDPTPGEPLLLYLAATTQVVSAVIVVERREEGHALAVQRSVYFVSEVLSDSKTRYLQILKILYGVVMAQRKLVHYFRAHPVTVVSSFPLGDVIRNRDSTGKLTNAPDGASPPNHPHHVALRGLGVGLGRATEESARGCLLYTSPSPRD